MATNIKCLNLIKENVTISKKNSQYDRDLLIIIFKCWLESLKIILKHSYGGLEEFDENFKSWYDEDLKRRFDEFQILIRRICEEFNWILKASIALGFH